MLYTKEQINQVEKPLEDAGAKIMTCVTAHKVGEDILYELDVMHVRFPNGKKWDIINIEFDDNP